MVVLVVLEADELNEAGRFRYARCCSLSLEGRRSNNSTAWAMVVECLAGVRDWKVNGARLATRAARGRTVKDPKPSTVGPVDPCTENSVSSVRAVGPPCCLGRVLLLLLL